MEVKGNGSWVVSVAVGNTTVSAYLWIAQRTDHLPYRIAASSTHELLDNQEPQRDASLSFAVRIEKAVTSMTARVVGAEGEGQSVPRVVHVILSGSVPRVIDALESGLKRLPWTRGRVCLFTNEHAAEHPRDSTSSTEDNPDKHFLVGCGLEVVPVPAGRVGKDRLAGALGALSLDPACGWVFVDLGTAITVNSVLPHSFVSCSQKDKLVGVFEGGLILPGEGLMLSSLSQGTAQLPRLPYWPTKITQPPTHAVILDDLDSDTDTQTHTPTNSASDASSSTSDSQTEVPIIGRSTEEAIRAGTRQLVLKGVVGIVREQVVELKRLIAERSGSSSCEVKSGGDDVGVGVRIAVTGGGAIAVWEEVEEHLKGVGDVAPVWDPLLVHRGLRYAMDLSSC